MTRQKDGCLRVAEQRRRIVRQRVCQSVNPIFAPLIRASVYGLRCAQRAPRSAQKTRFLSKKPGNLFTRAEVGAVTIEGKSALI
jgi:hypothetical protein